MNGSAPSALAFSLLAPLTKGRRMLASFRAEERYVTGALAYFAVDQKRLLSAHG